MGFSQCAVCSTCGKHKEVGDPMMMRPGLGRMPNGWLVIMADEGVESPLFCCVECVLLYPALPNVAHRYNREDEPEPEVDEYDHDEPEPKPCKSWFKDKPHTPLLHCDQPKGHMGMHSEGLRVW